MKVRFSILRLMAAVSLVGAECGLLRAAWGTTYFLQVLMVLPTLTLLLWNLPKLGRGHEARPYWSGFDAAALALAAFFIACFRWFEPETIIAPLLYLVELGWISREERPQDIAIACASVLAIYAFPQFLGASAAGWLSARYRVVILRRHPGAREGDVASGPAIVPTFREDPRPAVDR